MNIVYPISLVAVSLSISLGSIISLYTKEEIESGRRHLFLFLRLITSLIFGLAIYAATNSFPSGIMLAAASLATSFIPIAESLYMRMAFPLFGALFYAASKTPLFLAAASLIFLAGIIAGSLLHKPIKAGIPSLSFFCIAALLGFF